MLLKDLLNILDGKKQIQMYYEDGTTSNALSKEEWLKFDKLGCRSVLKVKNRPTDRYVFIELEGSAA